MLWHLHYICLTDSAHLVGTNLMISPVRMKGRSTCLAQFGSPGAFCSTVALAKVINLVVNLIYSLFDYLLQFNFQRDAKKFQRQSSWNGLVMIDFCYFKHKVLL